MVSISSGNGLILCVFILSFAFVNSQSLSRKCASLLIEDISCEWYKECLEQKYNCGPKGYPLGLGYKYCSKFGKWQAHPAVKAWVKKATKCLMQKLVPYLNSSMKISCAQLSKIGFQTHAECYEEGGFCQLPYQLGVKDTLIFLKQILGIYELKELPLPTLGSQIFQMSKVCMGKWLGFSKKNQVDVSQSDF